MLKLTLRQFFGLAAMIEDTVQEKAIPEDMFAHVELYIGNPASNGDITVDFKGPKSLMRK